MGSSCLLATLVTGYSLVPLPPARISAAASGEDYSFHIFLLNLSWFLSQLKITIFLSAGLFYRYGRTRGWRWLLTFILTTLIFPVYMFYFGFFATNLHYPNTIELFS